MADNSEPAVVICNKCQQAIGEGDYVNLETKFFHIDCFTCKKCDIKLGGKIYYEHGDDFYCEEDYQALFMTKCHNCGKVIRDQYLNILGKSYHAECFVCVDCKKPFQDDQYLNFDGNPYCQDCGKNKAKLCGGCGKPILDKLYSAIDKFWHLECFVCKKCGQPFSDGGFIPIDGQPYHQKCYQITCVVCGLICDTEYYQVENNQSVHEACLETYKKNRKEIQNQMQKAQQAIDNKQKDLEQKQSIPVQEKSELKQPVTIKTEEQIKPEVVQKTEEKKPEPVIEKQILVQNKEQKIEEGIKHNKLDKHIYPYEVLCNQPFPKDVDVTKREEYLSADDFMKIFKMDQPSFLKLAKWKQSDLKKRVKLF